MTEKPKGKSEKPDPDNDPEIELSNEEENQAEERASIDSNVVHEVVRREGHDELRRPMASLFWSGLAAGIAINTSILGQSMLEQALPDTPWRAAVSSIGYTLGFLIVILGRLQLFTESTLSAALPVATNPTLKNMRRIARLWLIVLIANLTGSFLVMALISVNAIGFPGQTEGMIELSRKLLEHDPMETLRGGIPAGFLLAAVAWSLPVGRNQEFWIIFFFTYFIALGGFSHVVAGSGEAWLLWLSGEASLGFALFGFILPALAGNVIGGTLIFALLAHAQVHKEIENNRDG